MIKMLSALTLSGAALFLPLLAEPAPGAPLCGVVNSEKILIDLTQTRPKLRHYGAEVLPETSDKTLRVKFLKKGGLVSIIPPASGWDVSDSVAVVIDISNEGDAPITLLADINRSRSAVGFLYLPPKKDGALVLYLTRPETEKWAKFPGMRGVPGGRMMHWDRKVNFEKIGPIRIRDIDGNAVGKTVTLRSIRAVGKYAVLPTSSTKYFFPFVDAFGQYKHGQWSGKIHTVDDLTTARKQETQDLDAKPRPTHWSQYGGWKDGPRLEATGHFRTAKHGGKWWLVDPEGHLFWSHGITGVGVGSRTRVAGRKGAFGTLPEAHRHRSTVDFFSANLEKKYGTDWKNTTPSLAHRRLQSWGMNSLGNWSEPDLCAQKKTPYVVAIGFTGKSSDVHNDATSLRQWLRTRMAQETTINDPWCIGYFVDNELDWNKVIDAEDYYRIVSEEVKRAAPHKLYLGSRTHRHGLPHGATLNTARAAAKYCDVIGINRYRFSPSDLQVADGFDKPIIIGEFHFGALDRGMLHPGLCGVGTQQQRGYAYRHYVTEALKHPNIVGTHWFRYIEQAVTGRLNGENYQIGFVDIADTPSKELVEAARWIGQRMYALRSEKPSQ